MWKAVAANALTLFIVGLIGVAVLIAWGRREFSGPGPLDDAICFRVDRGATMSVVAQLLKDRGAITDARIFRIGADYTGRKNALKFNSYLIPPGASMAEILDDVTTSGPSTCGAEVALRIGVATEEIILRDFDAAAGDLVEVAKFAVGEEEVPAAYADKVAEPDTRFQVILVEGATSWRAAEAINGAEFLAGEPVEVPPEGTLAPGSYDVARKAPRADAILRMSRRQTATLDELWEGRQADLPYATPQEALVMASIIEKETSVAEERPLIASVFVNRLRRGMPLQTDPTVIYGITGGRTVLDRGLRQSELRADTPYNTYVNTGLPPTPIANPGRASIAAALDPAASDYLFFVADGAGGHAFAATLDEHNRNVARWRQIEAQRKNAGD